MDQFFERASSTWAACSRWGSLTQTQVFSPGCSRAAFSKWKSAGVRAGTTLFIPGSRRRLSRVMLLCRLVSPLPLSSWLPGPLTHLSRRSTWVLFPDGSSHGKAHAQRKISARFELYCGQRWAGLYLVKREALQSSLREQVPASPRLPKKRSGLF